MEKLNVSEIFHTVQGEGVYTGANVVFIRLSGCNLRCKYCDSQYHWKGKIMTTKHIAKEVRKYNSYSVVITGGEPLLQQVGIYSLCQELADKHIMVETNGTIVPLKSLRKTIRHWAVSSKLASSGNDIDKRLNYDALEKFKELGSAFKFVISNKEDIKEVKKLQDQIKIESQQIYLMKEGSTAEKQYEGLQEFIKECISNGYNFSPRLHIMIWDNKRGV